MGSYGGISSDIEKFLYYMGIQDPDDIGNVSVPPYYQALYYNRSLANDVYVREKRENSLQAAIERSYTGKLYLNGNYTVVCSDPYALLQWAFSLDDKRVTGLLKRDEIYSHYWNRNNVSEVNVWRNPHIYREHWIGTCVDDDETKGWFRYLPSNTVVLMCFFPIVVSFSDGLGQMEEGYLNLLRTYGGSRFQLYRIVKIPSAVISLLSGLKVAATYSISGAVVGEWIASQSGLGYYLIRAKKK